MFSDFSVKAAAMNVETQFREIVIPYFNNVSKKYGAGVWNATKLYMANLAASSLYLAGNPNAVIYKAGDGGYTGNPGVDMDHNGKITVSDVTALMDYNRQNKAQYIAIMFRYKTLITPATGPQWGSAWSMPPGWPFT